MSKVGELEKKYKGRNGRIGEFAYIEGGFKPPHYDLELNFSKASLLNFSQAKFLTDCNLVLCGRFCV